MQLPPRHMRAALMAGCWQVWPALKNVHVGVPWHWQCSVCSALSAKRCIDSWMCVLSQALAAGPGWRRQWHADVVAALLAVHSCLARCRQAAVVTDVQFLPVEPDESTVYASLRSNSSRLTTSL